LQAKARPAGHRFPTGRLQNALPVPMARCRHPGYLPMPLHSIGTLRQLGLATTLLLAAPALAQKTELRILTWVEYMDPEVTAEFGRQHNFEFKYFFQQ
jgi:hypothetical protein